MGSGNPTCHVELIVNDTEAAKSFYCQVFNWTYDKAAQDFMPVDMNTAGMDQTCPRGGLRKQASPFVNLAIPFVEVTDVNSTLSAVETAGGQVEIDKTPHERGGFYGIFMDLDGIRIGVYEAPSQGS